MVLPYSEPYSSGSQHALQHLPPARHPSSSLNHQPLQVGLHCRGRLPLNLSLNFEAKEYLSINPSLQRTVDASKICSPVIQSGLAKGPVRFVCADLNSWHYRCAASWEAYALRREDDSHSITRYLPGPTECAARPSCRPHFSPHTPGASPTCCCTTRGPAESPRSLAARSLGSWPSPSPSRSW